MQLALCIARGKTICARAELGAGSRIPTVRGSGEALLREFAQQCTLIRVNPREPELGKSDGEHLGRGFVGLRCTGLVALSVLDSLLQKQAPA